MLKLPAVLQNRFATVLSERRIAAKESAAYQKWLRYYWDFCSKYRFDAKSRNSLFSFIGKLQEKGQSAMQQQQAGAGIKLFYEICDEAALELNAETAEMATCYYSGSSESFKNNPGFLSPEPSGRRQLISVPPKIAPQLSNPSTEEQGAPVTASPICNEASLNSSAKTAQASVFCESKENSSWQKEYQRLADEIKLRHYSPKTHRVYRNYVSKFQTFTKSIEPCLLTTDLVKEFLTYLAVKKQVSAATQNLAFNSLLFFFRHVLDKDFGKVEGVVRAKRRPYIPVVLSREEIDSILKNLDFPFDLIVKMLYGCGLRLFECLGLRIQCLNFDAGMVTVHDGKGQKDRTVPLPQAIVPELRKHVQSLKELHQQDLAKNYAGVFLVNALEKKYKNATKAFIWQWLFPAKQLTRVESTGEMRRYHLHESHVQKALRQGVDEAGICKRATAHTFRHYGERYKMVREDSKPAKPANYSSILSPFYH
jgi:integron integrase